MDELPPLSSPGQRLGRYELLQRLAVGGMAELFLARASGPADFRKLVAVKRMLPQHALDLQLLRMFRDEARLMARLAHPNIPQVYDVSDRADVPFFVMEYVPGTDLRTVLGTVAGATGGAPMPLEHAIGVASAVAAGLHHAHDQRGEDGLPLGIVHRDISPSNVLISFDGAVKVTDFGVAKWTEQRSFTEHGQLKGKLAHMSPEQCRGEPLDRRSDLFALGTLLYEMTTGRQPFIADSEYDLLSQIVSRDVPPPERPGGYPPELAAIVGRTLRRSRDERYPTAQALQLDLEAFAREQKLTVSQVSLAGYLESLFGPRVAGWRIGHAGGAGVGEPPTTPGDPRAVSRRTEPPTRTATDVFADTAARRDLPAPPVVPDGATAVSQEGAAPAPAAAADIAGAPTIVSRGSQTSYSAAGRRPGVPMLAATAALAVLALAAVAWTATRWRAPALPVAPSAAMPAPSPPTVAGTGAPVPVKTTPATTTAGGTDPERAIDTAVVSAAAEHAPERGAGAGTATTRTGRRRSAAAVRSGPGARTVTPDAAPAGAGATAAAAASRAATPAVKVWDPDSPVPP